VSATATLERWGLVAPAPELLAVPPPRLEDPDGVFVCRECSLPFSGFGETVRHMRTHLGGGRFDLLDDGGCGP